MRSWWRLLKFALQSISRNIWLSVATITVLVLTLLAINSVVALNVLAQAAVQSVESCLSVDIYFNPGTSETMQTNIRSYLAALPQVAEVQIVPADQALAEFKSRFAKQPEILAALEEVGENPLPPGLSVTAKQASDLPFLLQAVRTPEYSTSIRETVADGDIIAALKGLSILTERIRIFGLALASFFGLIAILITYNAIRMAIYVHREGIAVMRLVGAKNLLIRGPFIVEAIIYVSIAVILSGTIFMLSAAIFEPTLARYFSGINIGLVDFFKRYSWEIFGGQFLALCFLSAITTALAMRKYLKT